MTFTRERPEDQAVPPRPPGLWRGRTLGWRVKLTFAAVMVAGIITAVVLHWLSPNPDTPPAPAAQAPTATPARPAVPAPTGAACATWPAPAKPGQDGQVPTTWTLIGSVPAPASPDVGPAHTDPVRWCYAHTVTGALFAAANAVALISDPTIDRTTIALRLLADTPSRAVVLAVNATATAAPPAMPPSVASWTGYHVNAYSADRASIDTAHEFQGQLYAVTYTLIWAGDWKLVMPDALRHEERTLPILDPTYWTLWGTNS